MDLLLSGLDDRRCAGILDRSVSTAGGLHGLDDLQRSVIGDLTEDHVLAIEPRCHDSGDEELRAVAKN